MTISKKLNEVKEQIVAGLGKKVDRLKQERPPFNSHPENLKAYNFELDSATQVHLFALQRAGDFRVKNGLNYQCPRCWVVSGVQSDVDPKAIGTGTRDYFGCETCGLEVELTFGI